MRFYSVAGWMSLGLALAACGDENARPIVGGISWLITSDSSFGSGAHVQETAEEDFKVRTCSQSSGGYDIIIEDPGSQDGTRNQAVLSLTRVNAAQQQCVVRVTEYEAGGALSGIQYTDSCQGTMADGGCMVELTEGSGGWDLQVSIMCTRLQKMGERGEGGNPPPNYKLIAAGHVAGDENPVQFVVDNCN